MNKLICYLGVTLLSIIMFCGCNNRTARPTMNMSNNIVHDPAIQKGKKENAEYYEALCADSFIIRYSNAVNGYMVKAVAKVNLSEDSPVLCADIYFTKNGRTFMLHSMSFGDSVFSKGRMDPDGFNLQTFEKYRGKTIETRYKMKDNGEDVMLKDVPFFFKDLDFDDVPELVIVHKGMAVRFGDGYDVYRIVEGKPFMIDYPPYNQNKEEWGFGMTDYPRFDYRKKTICCPYPEGELSYKDSTRYGISKTEKEVVIVDGRKHYFNKIVKINAGM